MNPLEQLLGLSPARLALVISGLLILIFGIHYSSYQCAKRNQKAWSFFGNIFDDFSKFDLKEWVIFIASLVVGCGFVFLAVAMGK